MHRHRRQSAMPRDDLQHWSQRVRDQRIAYAPAPPATAAPSSPPRRAAKPRVTRPKPRRDEDAEQLLRLCREGRLFELQAWVQEGKPLTVPIHYRRTPLHVALDTGFHSLIEFLLQHENDQTTKDATPITNSVADVYAQIGIVAAGKPLDES